MDMKRILVNAPALTSGGGLTILKQFLNNFPTEHQLFAFVSVKFHHLPSRDNIVYINTHSKAWSRRIIWDYWGINNWCKKNSIKPDLIISLQNTGVRVNVKQLIYYHQAIPLYEYRWSLLKKSQRHLWFYKNIYPRLVKANINDRTIFVAQFNWIKSRMEKVLKIPKDSIKVIKPGVDGIFTAGIKKICLKGSLSLFYPATPYDFKNHREIINAFIYLKNHEKLKDYFVYLTCNKEDLPTLYRLISEHDLQDHFVFLGVLEYAQVLSYYKSADVTVFPSFLETFGLPIVEAAAFGKKLLLADMDYAREVAENYPGAEFLPIHNPEAWANAIENFAMRKTEFAAWTPDFSENSWSSFFSLVSDCLELEKKNNADRFVTEIN